MLYQDKKNNFAQITTEYAVLIALIIAALVAMQVYFKRGVQAHLKDAMDYPMNSSLSTGFFSTSQYEPGMTNTTRIDERNETFKESMTRGLGISREIMENVTSNINSTTGDFE